VDDGWAAADLGSACEPCRNQRAQLPRVSELRKRPRLQLRASVRPQRGDARGSASVEADLKVRLYGRAIQRRSTGAEDEYIFDDGGRRDRGALRDVDSRDRSDG